MAELYETLADMLDLCDLFPQKAHDWRLFEGLVMGTFPSRREEYSPNRWLSIIKLEGNPASDDQIHQESYHFSGDIFTDF
jgi:hypothetical protein